MNTRRKYIMRGIAAVVIALCVQLASAAVYYINMSDSSGVLLYSKSSTITTYEFGEAVAIDWEVTNLKAPVGPYETVSIEDEMYTDELFQSTNGQFGKFFDVYYSETALEL